MATSPTWRTGLPNTLRRHIVDRYNGKYGAMVSFSEPFAEPLRAAQIMIGFPHPWCICGGWAIDLFMHRVSRQHKDVDIAVRRGDQLALRSHLVAQGWALEKAVDGQLAPWPEGEFIELPVHTIWCKNPNAQPDFVEVLFNEVSDGLFSFRRGQSITRPLADAIVLGDEGIPILAPEIVLLYKANNPSHEGNRGDFEVALPHPDADRRA